MQHGEVKVCRKVRGSVPVHPFVDTKIVVIVVTDWTYGTYGTVRRLDGTVG